MSDPAHSAVQINYLARQLNDLMANTGYPNIEEILNVCVDIRAHANQVRMWAHDKEQEQKLAA